MEKKGTIAAGTGATLRQQKGPIPSTLPLRQDQPRKDPPDTQAQRAQQQ